MKLLKKLSKKATAFALAVALLFGMNTMSTFAATPDPGVSPQTVITPWNGPVSFSTTHKTSGIGVRANEPIRLDLNITHADNGRYDYPLTVRLITRDGTVVQTISYHDVGSYSHTFTTATGGSFYIEFGTRPPARFTINYTVTF